MKAKPTNRPFKNLAWVLSVWFLFLHSGCGLLNPDSFTTENGYYTRHYNSCAPEAIQDAMEELENKIITTKSIFEPNTQDHGNFPHPHSRKNLRGGTYFAGGGCLTSISPRLLPHPISKNFRIL